MVSTIGELINPSILTLRYDMKVEEALNAVSDADVEYAIVLDENNHVFAIAEDIELEDADASLLVKEISFQNKFKGVNAQLHIYDALKLMSINSWDIIPVLDDDFEYLGAVSIHVIKSEIVENLAYKLSGAIIILRQLESDYSLAEIVRICEANDCRVMSVGTQKEVDSRGIFITLKLEKSEVSSLIASFTRYEYEIIATYGNNMYHEDLKDRLDLLMHYINM